MFDIGFWELSLIGVVALLVIGPERLPGFARRTGMWLGRARRFVADVKSDIDSELKTEEFAKLKQFGKDMKGVRDELVEAAGNMVPNSKALPQGSATATSKSKKKRRTAATTRKKKTGSRKKTASKKTASKKTASRKSGSAPRPSGTTAKGKKKTATRRARKPRK